MKEIRKFYYSHLEEFIEDVLSCPKERLKGGDGKHASKSWSGADSWKEATEILREGIGIDKIGNFVALENNSNLSMKSVNDVHGAVVDMGAFLEGTPENMIDFPIVDNTEFVDIIVDLSEASGVDASTVERKAAAIIGLVDKLEATGHRVRVDVVYLISLPESDTVRRDQPWLTKVNVKKHQEPLALGQLAGCMSPCFQRWFMFAQEDKYTRPPSGYGDLRTDRKLMIDELQKEATVDTVFIPSVTNGGYSYGTLETARETVEKFYESIWRK